MKNLIKKGGLIILATIAFMSCTKDDEVIATTEQVLAPQNQSPANGKSFSADEASQPITFRWTPIVPKPQEPVTYRLKVWQLMQGQNGTQAMRTNQPIVMKDVADITEATVQGIYTGPCKPPYLCDFIWTVQAIDSNEIPIGNNNGTSEPSIFNF
jgi:hypothetical protein